VYASDCSHWLRHSYMELGLHVRCIYNGSFYLSVTQPN